MCVLDPAGARLTQQCVTHDVARLAELDTVLALHETALPIAVERAEGLLVEHLQARGHIVFPVSPRIAAGRGSATGSPRSRTTGSTRSCWPTPCATSPRTGGP
ncbi:hypothetical protein [Pseudonocardia kujensis]|uniref:hypothetical protein n=1 Tax=Pseudonocardia kujensis TaxID=1128675 RepID=UPI0035584A1E